jgi:GNAT superfamily N-acetyltransferase
VFQAAVLRSEAAIVAALGEVTDRGSYVRFWVPGMPENMALNALVFRDEPAPEDVRRWLALRAEAFPNGPTRQRLSWDTTREAGPAIVEAFAAQGYQAFSVRVLVAERPRPAGAVPVRRLQTDEDWTEALYTSALVAPAPPGPKVYAHHRAAMTTFRAACEAGHGAFFGAWEGDACIGLLGIFKDGEGLARYQWIVTAPHHRRKGVCGTLMHAAAEWAGASRCVVLGLGNNEAGLRAYAAAGFEEAERQTWFWPG